MVGLEVNAKEEIHASSSTTQRWRERKQHLQRQKGNNAKATPAIVGNLDDDSDILRCILQDCPQHARVTEEGEVQWPHRDDWHRPMSSTTTYHVIHVQGKGKKQITLTRKHELFNSFVTTCNGFSDANLVQPVVVLWQCSWIHSMNAVMAMRHTYTLSVVPRLILRWEWRATRILKRTSGPNYLRTTHDDTIPHVPGKFGKKGNVRGITMPIELWDPRFIVGLRQWSWLDLCWESREDGS